MTCGNALTRVQSFDPSIDFSTNQQTTKSKGPNMSDDSSINPAENADRISTLIGAAVAGLSAEDRAERTAYCKRHNEHGVRLHTSDDDDVLEFMWGGKRLAMVHRDDLYSDDPLVGEFVADVPDTPDAL